jgi:pyruvate dehydrogenase E2 component (dihydrolipoamide acetyltransferase)
MEEENIMAEVTMPRLSDTMTEGTIGRWLKQEGDQVQKGDILVEIETDKATMELEAYESGVLQKIMVPDGQLVPIGETIAMIGDSAAESTPAAAEQPVQQKETVAPAAAGADGNGRAAPQPAPAAAPAPTVIAAGEHIKASPLARRVAADYGVDLGQVQGSGPGGRIIRENVETFYQQHGTGAATQAQPPQAAAPQQAAAPATQPAGPPPPQTMSGVEPQPLTRMRRAIAQRMSEAKNGTPHFYVTSDIDMGELLALRRQLNDSGAADVKISVNDFIIKAMAKTLREFPELNSSYVMGDDGQVGIVQHEHVNINVAISIDEGLIVPVVEDADTKSLGTIAAEVKDLAARAREGKIKQHELEGGTFTVSNMGMFDVSDFIAIITPPQAGVLAISSIIQQPVVRDGEIAIADMMSVTLSADHRVVDGATGAKCIHAFKRLMQSPLKLLV